MNQKTTRRSTSTSYRRQNGNGHPLDPLYFQHVDPITLNQLNSKLDKIITTNASLSSRDAILSRDPDKRRNIDKDCGYPDNVSPEDYRYAFNRSAIANRVVNVMPSESWLVHPSLYEDEDPEVLTAFEEAFESLIDNLDDEENFYGGDGESNQGRLWEFLRRADILSGIGTYGVILIGVDDGKDLSEPLEMVSRKSSQGKKAANGVTANKKLSITYLRAFDESMAPVAAYDTDRTSARYMKPERYNLTFSDYSIGGSTTSVSMGSSGVGSVTKSVHWTRVIHIADNTLGMSLFGIPRMFPVFNNLMDCRKLYGGSAEMYWMGAFPPYTYETDPALGGDVDVDVDDLKDQIEQMVNSLQRHEILMGLTKKQLSPSVVDPRAQIEVQIEAICIQIAIPVRIFKGSERGQLASSQDEKNWNRRMKSRQVNHISTNIIAPFTNRLINIGVLPAPSAGKYLVKWPELSDPTEEIRYANAKTFVDFVSTYTTAGMDAIIQPRDLFVHIAGMDESVADSILENTMEAVSAEEPDPMQQKLMEVRDAGVPLDEEAQARADAAGEKKGADGSEKAVQKSAKNDEKSNVAKKAFAEKNKTTAPD